VNSFWSTGTVINPKPVVEVLWCSEYGVRVRFRVSRVGSVSRVGYAKMRNVEYRCVMATGLGLELGSVVG